PAAGVSVAVAPNAFTWSQALARGEALMAEAAATHGFKVLEGAYLGFDARRGTWSYSAVTDQDPDERHGSSKVRFDAQTGALLEARHVGVDTAGDRVTSWIAALHMGHVFGTWYRIVVMLVGGVVVTLSVTGVEVWWNKRTVRRRQATAGGRRRSDPVAARPGAEPTHDVGPPALGSPASPRSTSAAR
ncbi:MAG: PepSY domain-containing protein, partial [Burkholderiales bacterium]|nr:PepSY domain-containing protein [Burkholderiales bacterium]